ncbi:MAG: cupin domain-containing protein [Bacteroidia bacterium]
MRYIFMLLLGLCFAPEATAQNTTHQSLDTITVPTQVENVYNRPLYHDSAVSSFVLVIYKEVKKHKHEHHAEHVYIISGEADMLLGDSTIHIRAGDLIFIPANMPHAVRVTSKEPLKVLSIQAPYFDGKDRVMLDK